MYIKNQVYQFYQLVNSMVLKRNTMSVDETIRANTNVVEGNVEEVRGEANMARHVADEVFKTAKLSVFPFGFQGISMCVVLFLARFGWRKFVQEAEPSSYLAQRRFSLLRA